MTRFAAIVFVSTLLWPALVQGQTLTLPTQPGQALSLAPDDWRLELEKVQTWRFQAAPAGRQTVLNFRVRIDNPSTLGSCNMLAIELNGQPVGLKTPRRQLCLLNKPNKFAWSDPTSLTWFVPPTQWRIVYAPDFEVLKNTRYYNEESYRFTLDVSDLVRPGENTLTFTHTGNVNIARNAKCDLALVFRDLRLEVREGVGVTSGEAARPPRFRPFVTGQKRSASFTVGAGGGGGLALTAGSHRYRLNSRFSEAGPDGKIAWQNLRHEGLKGTLQTRDWRLQRTVRAEPEMGRLLIEDAFQNVSDRTVGIRVEHALEVQDGLCERVNFGGREDPNLDELNRPECPYLFLPRTGGGLGLVAYDDVLRMHALLTYDDRRQVGGLRDDWFGLPPKSGYTMTWAVYCTATDNVFDLVNLVRRDWDVSFRLDGGINFFDPDAVLAYDDAKLKQHLEQLNINITMSQGGWVDRKRVIAGEKNCGHGPIVTGDYYADYRLRLRAACEKLRRLRPGIKCLIYYDTWLVSGNDILQRYSDSLYTRLDGRPRNYQAKTEFGFPIANVVPTLENTMGRETLAKIPGMILDEIGADGLYWDEIGNSFGGNADYAHPDPHTVVIDAETGAVVKPAGAPDLASQPFKLALMKAFFDRGATIVGNSPPTTLTETRQRFIRFTETDIPHHPGLVTKTWLFTPVSYAGWSTYHLPKVTEADFLRDIKEKLWNANLYLFSAPMFYPLFTRENLATYEYPITVTELDEGVIIGKERLITLRPGRFGWPGAKWSGTLLLFDPEQCIVERRAVTPEKDGCVMVDLQPEWAAVIVRGK